MKKLPLEDAEPRFTKNIDILIDSESSNAKNLVLTTGNYGNIEAFFISKQDLIKSKRLSGRKLDY